MSTTLFFLVPIGLVALVWSLCFVGCILPGATTVPGSLYSNNILAEASLVAYWPLGDLMGPAPPPPQGSTSVATAADLSGSHPGSYLLPPGYPTTVPQSASFASQTLHLQQASIVPGDAGGIGAGNKNPIAASVDFEGGYVSIPWSTQNSPTLPEFTLEAWIKPNWAVTGFIRVVFSAFINNTGFVVFINDNNQWQVTIGTGAGHTMSPPMVAADLTSTTYVAVTFDSTTNTVSLWLNPASDTQTPPTPAQTFTANYVPVDPTQPVTFFIGAGANDQALRTHDGDPGAPLYSFQGRIQSVALYKTALGATDLQSHFTTGAI